jgi:uncharacterized protein YndB with AHSA1/START domain
VTYHRRGTITVDQFVAAPPSAVWRALTDPETHARWWAPGDVRAEVGHEFHLQMPGFGAVACRVLEAVEPERFVYTFDGGWTLIWTLAAEGRGTRLLLEHAGFDLDDQRQRDACDRMGPGWRDVVLPRLAETVQGVAVPR